MEVFQDYSKIVILQKFYDPKENNIIITLFNDKIHLKTYFQLILHILNNSFLLLFQYISLLFLNEVLIHLVKILILLMSFKYSLMDFINIFNIHLIHLQIFLRNNLLPIKLYVRFNKGNSSMYIKEYFLQVDLMIHCKIMF